MLSADDESNGACLSRVSIRGYDAMKKRGQDLIINKKQLFEESP